MLSLLIRQLPRRAPGLHMAAGHPLARKLELAWLAGEGAGSRVDDASGRNRRGSITGAFNWVTGPALNFSGGRASAALALAGDLTIATRIRFDVVDADARLAADGTSGFRGATVLAADRWYHAALTLAGTAITLYLDGRIDSAGTLTPGATGAEIALGANPDAPGIEPLDGRAEFLFAWSRALTAWEVREHYRDPLGMMRPIDLAAWLPAPGLGINFGALTPGGARFGDLNRASGGQ